MKTLINNVLGTTKKTFAVPATATNAETFASTMLEGEYTVWDRKSNGGTSTTVTAYKKAFVCLKSSTGASAYLNLLVPSNKTNDQIISALTGVTVDGVLAHDVKIYSLKPVTLS